MRVLVCGARDFLDERRIRSELDALKVTRGPFSVLIHGRARGVDTWAAEWALDNGINLEGYKADWDAYGKSAGPIRNSLMLKEGKPDLVVAFPSDRSIGTWDMVRKARKAGVETIVVRET